jgi:ATP-binding cassette, subfamily B, bacterial
MSAELASPGALVWPFARIGEAMVALARHAGLIGAAAPAARLPPSDDAALDRWLSAAGEQLGLNVEPVLATHRETDAALGSLFPAMVRLPEGVLVVVKQRGKALLCLCPDGGVRPTPRQAVRASLAAPHEGPHRARISALLDRSSLSPAARTRAGNGMLDEFLATTKVLQGWLLRLPPSASFFRQAQQAGLIKLGAVLVTSHVAQYLLFLISWATIGRAVLRGTLASGWLWGWALILLTLVPLTMISTWCQGKLSVGFGMLLRRRLLAGALELPPAMVNRDGVGGLLGRTIEADALERLALGGGFLSLLAILELALAVPILAAGAVGWAHAALLIAWMGMAGVLAARLARARSRWTDQRLALTGLTVERIVGHRTRLAQEVPERWHDGEDESLAGYLDRSKELDRRTLALQVLVPRGWLLAGLIAMAPAFIRGAAVPRRGGHLPGEPGRRQATPADRSGVRDRGAARRARAGAGGGGRLVPPRQPRQRRAHRLRSGDPPRRSHPLAGALGQRQIDVRLAAHRHADAAQRAAPGARARHELPRRDRLALARLGGAAVPREPRAERDVRLQPADEPDVAAAARGSGRGQGDLRGAGAGAAARAHARRDVPDGR